MTVLFPVIYGNSFASWLQSVDRIILTSANFRGNYKRVEELSTQTELVVGCAEHANESSHVPVKATM